MEIGDKYLIIRTGFASRRVESGEVTRTTKTRFNIGEYQFMKSNGWAVGSGLGVGSTRCEPYKPEKHDEQLSEQKINDQRLKLYRAIEPEMKKLSLEKLTAIHDIIFTK